MFAERALTASVGSGAKQEESLSYSLSFFLSLCLPSKVPGHRGRGANRILAAWPPSAPGAGLRSFGSFSLFFAPRDTSPHPRQLGRGGGGEELGEALGKEKKWAKPRSSGLTAQKRARTPRLGGRQPSQVPWHGGTHRNPEPRLAEQGWTVELAGGGVVWAGGGEGSVNHIN